jgi:lipopolysaccharide export system protein LptA
MLRLICAASVAGALAAAASVPSAYAQGIGSSFQQYQGEVDAPINIEADVLEVDDKAKRAAFKGNVVASQGGFSLKSRELIVHYTGSPAGDVTQASAKEAKPAAGRKGAEGSIKRIEAKGKVIVATKDGQTATSEWADFDVEQQLVTIGGNVVLSQGENVLRGDRLVIDLKTGKSRFEVKGEAGKQRIRGLFLPKQDDKDKKK